MRRLSANKVSRRNAHSRTMKLAMKRQRAALGTTAQRAIARRLWTSLALSGLARHLRGPLHGSPVGVGCEPIGQAQFSRQPLCFVPLTCLLR